MHVRLAGWIVIDVLAVIIIFFVYSRCKTHKIYIYIQKVNKCVENPVDWWNAPGVANGLSQSLPDENGSFVECRHWSCHVAETVQVALTQ